MTQYEQEYWDELVMVAKRKKDLATTMVITPDQILAMNDEIIRLKLLAIVKNELEGEIK